jgi:hypothetical protein
MQNLLIALFVLVSAPSFSQIALKYTGAKRAFYHQGDTIGLVLVMKLNPRSCLDGMKKTYIYYSGCEDILQKNWKQLPNRLFQKHILVKISTQGGHKARVTITRDTDKESFFRQEAFNIK